MTLFARRGILLRKKLRALIIRIQRNIHYQKLFGWLLLFNLIFHFYESSGFSVDSELGVLEHSADLTPMLKIIAPFGNIYL
jgi:hypothetical protein